MIANNSSAYKKKLKLFFFFTGFGHRLTPSELRFAGRQSTVNAGDFFFTGPDH